MPLGALCTGGYALAQAGLLDGYHATIHWENLSALREQFPRVLISDHLFTIDRNRYTCSGGVAPLELMLNLIEEKLGPQVSQRVSEQFIVERIRDGNDRQYVPLRAQVGAVHRSVIAVASLMEANIENPLPLEDDRAPVGLVAAADRAAVQAARRLRAEAVLPRAAVEARTRVAAADVDADHGDQHGVRIPVAAALLEVLSESVRASADRRATTPARVASQVARVARALAT